MTCRRNAAMRRRETPRQLDRPVGAVVRQDEHLVEPGVQRVPREIDLCRQRRQGADDARFLVVDRNGHR